MPFTMQRLAGLLLCVGFWLGRARRTHMLSELTDNLTVIVNHTSDMSAFGECSEPAVQKDCYCEKRSARGYQCSSCKDPYKWGYGCKLHCPKECFDGCDFIGDCVVRQMCPPGCKRNSRSGSSSSGDCLNSRAECQACQSGFFGLRCDQQCPETCGPSPEGMCDRTGHCYSCKTGWYGERCDQQCPEGCPLCVMKDGLVPNPKRKGQFLSAGVCAEQCRTNSWGEHCQNPCRKTCRKLASSGGEADCERGTGKCFSCAGNRHYGDTCNTRCSDGCLGGECEQATGHCIKGCKAGFWGSNCTSNCPHFTGPEGCARKDGFPVTCTQGYPSYQGEPPFITWTQLQGTCQPCPWGCANNHTCKADGSCMGGCTSGFHGPRCDKECEPTCEGPCDKATTGKAKDGECLECKPGYTGPKCLSHCHKTCASCKQSVNMAFVSKPGVGPKDCTACHKDEPAFLDSLGQCSCINGAARLSGPIDDGVCHCPEPDDVMQEAFFKRMPEKVCGKRCKINFNGQALKEIHKLGEDYAPPKCVSGRIIKAVYKAEGTLTRGVCGPDELQITTIDDVDEQCMHVGYINYILAE